MKFTVKAPILGFEDIKTVELSKSDENFAILNDTDSQVFFTLVNPYSLREYSFDVSTDIQKKLEIKENSELLVYNIVALGTPSEDSLINFLAPLVFNVGNNTVAQVVLDSKTHPDLSVAQKISDFIKE